MVPQLVAALQRQGLAGGTPPPPVALAPVRRRPVTEIFDRAALESARSLPGVRGLSLLPELIDRYLQEEPKLLANLAELHSARRAAELAFAAHSFAGEAASFGAVLVRQAALALESVAHAEDWPAVADWLTELRNAASDLRSALSEIVIDR
jgi:HPt (histidine-containing phosphotransfer) domain-containing protein